jgi:lambda family phage portal protein
VSALEKLRSLFGGAARGAGYPAIGDAVTGAGYDDDPGPQPRRRPGGSYYTALYGRNGIPTGSGGYLYDGAKWSHGLAASGRTPVIDHALARANARAAVHDSPTARSIIDRYEQTVVDTGVRVECAPDATLLGITPEAAETWAADVESRFHLWASSQLSSAAEDMTFYQAQRFSMRSRKRDGEYFARLYYDSRRDLLNPLRIGWLDPGQIRGDARTDTAWPTTEADGIVRDERGRELAFDVLARQADGAYRPVRIPAVSPRSGLPVILHGYAPEYAGQGRGYSPIAHAIHEFQLITDLSVAVIKKAALQASIAMYVKPSEKADAMNPFLDQASGPTSASQPPEKPAETEDPEEQELVTYSQVNEFSARPGSAAVFNLQAGSDLILPPSTQGAESFSSFVEAFVGYIAASVNMPPEILSLKFSNSYSASRAALILFWRTACIERDEEASDFYNPIFRAWLTGEIAAGRVSAPGWSDPRLRAAWCVCSWNGPPMPNIDPAKTANADKAYIELGAQTLDTVARNYNGSSGAANRAKLSRQLLQLPVPPWAKKSATPSPGSPGTPGALGGGSDTDSDDEDTDQDTDTGGDAEED